ncbi:MAG: hypothetical protein M1480_15000 [Bacteroidetes bacterium]|nr:hypothetical protein [Bacteroidota bacterium]
MKYICTLILIFFTTVVSFPQNNNQSDKFDIRGGMGISFLSMPSLTDYLNLNFAAPNQQLGTFVSAVNFSGEAGYLINDHYEIGIEVAYMINSYNYSYSLGEYRLNYGILMPSILNYYVIKGEGFYFKFGGGVGPRFVSATQQLPGTPSAQTYSSTGFGLILKADGNTLLSGKLYANIGVDLKYDFNGEPKSGNQYFVNNVYKQNVNFNALSAGIRLGVSYLF